MKNWKTQEEEEERVPKQEPDYDFGNDQEEEEKVKDLKDNRESEEEETKAVSKLISSFLIYI